MSADQKVLTVKLRRGIRWSDGEPFTTEDVRFFWEDVRAERGAYAEARWPL